MIQVHFDGACEPNPAGVAAYGVIIRRDGVEIWRTAERVECTQTSSNVAEYAGFVAALRYLIDAGLKGEPIEMRGDSQLVIRQMFGTWQINNGAYADLAREAKTMLRQFQNITGSWIPRDRNNEADALSRIAIEPDPWSEDIALLNPDRL
jgi:ribonuclease HI